MHYTATLKEQELQPTINYADCWSALLSSYKDFLHPFKFEIVSMNRIEDHMPDFIPHYCRKCIKEIDMWEMLMLQETEVQEKTKNGVVQERICRLYAHQTPNQITYHMLCFLFNPN